MVGTFFLPQTNQFSSGMELQTGRFGESEQPSVSQKVTCYADSAYLSQDASREVLVQICCKGSGSYLINFTKTGITLYDSGQSKSVGSVRWG